MFNWIQTYLTKHFKWILIILLAVMIVSFVFTIGNFSPLGGSRGGGYREQPFLGYDLSSQRDQLEIFGRGQTSLQINLPFYASNERIAQDYSLSRSVFLHLADEMGLPGPTKDEFKEFVRELPAFMNYSTQEFDQARFTAFIDSLKANGLTEAYVTSILEDDYRVNKIREVLGGPGHILPFEAVHATQRQNTEWTLEIAKMAYNDFSPEISPTEEDLNSYFSSNTFRYEVAAKAKASYVTFDPKTFIDSEYQPEPGEKSIHFFTNKARYQAAIPKPEPVEKEDGTTETPEAPEVTLNDVEDQVVEEIRLDRAKKDAQKVAEKFAYNLFDLDIKNGSAAFETALSEAGVTLNPLTPYSEGSVLTQNGLQPQTLSQLFRLSEDRYYSDPIENGDIYVVLIYQGEIPSYTPELPEVKAKVEADLVEEKKRALFVEKGTELKEAIANAMAGGDNFETAATAQNLEHQSFDSFMRNATPPDGLDQNLLSHLDSLEQGEVSDWIAGTTDGTFIYAAAKSVPDLETDAEEVKTFLEQQSQYLGASNVEPIVREMLRKELANTAFAQNFDQ